MISNMSSFVALFTILFGCVLGTFVPAQYGDIQLQVYPGSTKYWLAVNTSNEKLQTLSVEIREAKSLRWVPTVYSAKFGYFQLASTHVNGFQLPLSFRFNAANDSRVVAVNILTAIQPGQMIDTLVQYANSTSSSQASTTPPTVPATTASITSPPTAHATQAPPAQGTTKPTQGPATQAPATQPPVTQAPATHPPVTQAPVTQPPATQPPTVPTSTPAPVNVCAIASPVAEPATIMVPLYVYPGAAWDQLIQVASTGVKIIAVINPFSGPIYTGPDANYISYMQQFQAAGIEMVGYVHTSWATRNLTVVLNEINIWATKYTGINGIFFDEGAVPASGVPYYSAPYDAVMALGWAHAIINPGQEPDPGYMTVSTNIVIFEDYADNLMTKAFSTWVTCAPTQEAKPNYQYRFTGIMHTAALADMPWLIGEAYSKGMGMVYVTDGAAGCCTYNELTSYFPQEGASALSFNTA